MSEPHRHYKLFAGVLLCAAFTLSPRRALSSEDDALGARAEAHFHNGLLALDNARYEDAAAQLEAAQQLVPSREIDDYLYHVHLWLKRSDAAADLQRIQERQRLHEVEPGSAHWPYHEADQREPIGPALARLARSGKKGMTLSLIRRKPDEEKSGLRSWFMIPVIGVAVGIGVGVWAASELDKLGQEATSAFVGAVAIGAVAAAHH